MHNFFKGKEWKNAVTVRRSLPENLHQNGSTNTVTKVVESIKITEVGKDTFFIVDMGQNFAGVTHKVKKTKPVQSKPSLW